MAAKLRKHYANKTYNQLTISDTYETCLNELAFYMEYLLLEARNPAKERWVIILRPAKRREEEAK